MYFFLVTEVKVWIEFGFSLSKLFLHYTLNQGFNYSKK